tara:strand:- start:7758 stop:8372 length:615 start_codon:yes stop_codon:yes gene_type:complete
MAKRGLDIILLIVGFLIFAPIFVVIIFLVVLSILIEDGRPVFYTQKRYGKNKKIFKLYKFRSMIKNAEQRTGAVWALKDKDPRLTKTGKFIRKYAIDEMPQLINIFKGDISFVGPRPERPELFNEFAIIFPDFKKRLLVPQGLTGIAQLLGTYDASPKNKIRYDLIYIKNQSLLMDIKIIILSVIISLIGNWQSDSRSWLRNFF